MAMDVSEETLRRVADIARLKLSPEELVAFQTEITAILDHFSTIQKVAGASPSSGASSLTNPLRDDKVEDCSHADALTAGFAKKDGRFLVAPKSLE